MSLLPAATRTVLVVEDDEATAELERRALSRSGLQARVVTRVKDALALLEVESFAAILLDYQLPDGDPWRIVEVANAKLPRVPVILVTAMGNERVAAEAIHRGVADYVKKADTFWDQLPRMVERVTRLSDAEEQLRLEQARLAEAQRLAHLGSWEWDVPHNRVTWSDELYRIFGRDRASFGASYEAYLECVHPDDRAQVARVITRALETREAFHYTQRIVSGGVTRYVESRGTVKLGADGSVLRMLGTAQDVTEREEQQAKLRESDAFFELSLDLLSTAGIDGYFRRINPAFKVLGWSEQEVLTTPFLDFVHPDDVESTLAEVEKLAQGIKTLHFENRYRCKDGSYRWISWVSSPHPDGTLYGTGRDITEQKLAEEERERMTEQLRTLNASLTRTLKEREVLLQEIHHRVKNNLQVISSLINLQIRKLEAGENRDALEECRTRVQAIALIHEQLYQSSDYARVPFAEYAKSLASSVFRATTQSVSNVRLELYVDDIALAVDQAIPCGLVLNELITNALKHGFSDGRPGTIRVEFSKTDAGLARLAVSNDGIGLPLGFDSQSSLSLGLHLVSTLATQLDAELEVVRGAATTFQLKFQLPEEPSAGGGDP